MEERRLPPVDTLRPLAPPLLTALSDLVPAGLCLIDATGRYVEVNNTYCRIYGYTRAALLGQSIALVMPTEEVKAITSILAQFRTAGRAGVPTEQRRVRKDGSALWIEEQATLVNGEDGQPLILLTAIDITTRKAAEAAPLASEARYRSLFLHMQEGLAYCRMLFQDERPHDFMYLEVNAAFTRLTGLTDPVGKLATVVMPGVRESDPELFALFGRVVTTGTPEKIELYVVALRRLFALSVYRPHPEHFVAVFDLVTARKRAQAAVRESEEKYKRLIETTTTGYVILDGDGLVIDANPEYVRLAGRERLEDVVGRRVLEWTAPQDRERNAAEVRRCLEHGRVRDLEITYVNSAGQTTPIEVNATVIHTAEGIRVLSLCRDITERKRAEAALRRRTQQLEAIRAVSAEIAHELDLTRLLGLIHRRAAELLGARSGFLSLYDETTKTLTLRSWEGHGDWVSDLRFRLGEGIAGTVAARRRGMVVNDYRSSPYTMPLILDHTSVTSVVAEPLLYRDRVVGVVTLDNQGTAERTFTEEDREILALFAVQAAIAIENARAHERALRRGEQLEALLRASWTVMAGLDLPSTLKQIVAEAARIAGAEQVKLLLVDHEAQVLRLSATQGVESPPGMVWPLGETLSGRVVRTGEPFFLADSQDASLNPMAAFDHERGLRTYLGVPVKVGAEVLGVLTVNTTEPRTYSPDELRSLTAFAAQAAIAIEHARLFQQEQTRRMQLEAIRAVTVEITRELDVKALLQLIIERATRLVGAAAGTVLLWNEAEQLLVPCAWLGYGEWRGDMRFRLGEGVVGEIAARRAGIIANEYPTQPFAHAGSLARMPITAAMGEPLLYRDRLIGVLTLIYTEPGKRFTRQDQELLRLFAAQAAIAIENAGLHEAAVRRGAELETLLAATRSVMSGLDLQEILDRIVAEAHRISGAPHVKILLFDRPAGVLRVGAARGTAHRPGETLPLDTGLSAHVVRSGEPLYIAQCTEDPRNRKAARDRALGIQTYLGLPITRGDEVLGVLTFNTTTPKAFSPAELAYLTSFAAQAAIAIENARLFAELHDSYARLQEAQAELVRSEKLRGLGQMAAGIAHDLNNTLAAILGQVDLLKLRDVSLDLQENLRTLETAATDGAHVVRRLQDFARLRGSSPLGALTLLPVVQEALHLTAPRWKDEVQRRGHTIEVHVALEALPPILGHAPEIREALTNVIFNAVDAMPEGGALTFTGTATEDEVCLQVADTGVGMPEAVRQKVFEPFFTTKGVKGTGLGLSVVYGIMERHGGRVTVDSLPGKGTTVTLRFQAASTVSPGATPDPLPDQKPARRILVIDDEAAVRHTMADLLRAAGQTVYVAESGPAGLAQLATAPVDLVLTDLGMPGMTGWDVARAVKDLHPQLPVVLLTGWGEQAMGDPVANPAVDQVLGKPVRLEEMLRTIARLTPSPAADG